MHVEIILLTFVYLFSLYNHMNYKEKIFRQSIQNYLYVYIALLNLNQWYHSLLYKLLMRKCLFRNYCLTPYYREGYARITEA